MPDKVDAIPTSVAVTFRLDERDRETVARYIARCAAEGDTDWTPADVLVAALGRGLAELRAEQRTT